MAQQDTITQLMTLLLEDRQKNLDEQERRDRGETDTKEKIKIDEKQK